MLVVGRFVSLLLLINYLCTLVNIFFSSPHIVVRSNPASESTYDTAIVQVYFNIYLHYSSFVGCRINYIVCLDCSSSNLIHDIVSL